MLTNCRRMLEKAYRLTVTRSRLCSATSTQVGWTVTPRDQRAQKMQHKLFNTSCALLKNGLFYTDDAPELKLAAKSLGWRHATSTPGRPQSNGVAERAVRTVLEGARAILDASGLPSRWWSRAVRHYCMMHNVTQGRAGKPTPWESRFGEPFLGDLHPFGCQITYKYALQDQNPNDTKFGPSGKQGVLVGYHMNPGGKWPKYVQVLDMDSIKDNFGSKFLPTRRCGEIWRDKGIPKFPCKRNVPSTFTPPAADAPPDVIQTGSHLETDADAENESEKAIEEPQQGK